MAEIQIVDGFDPQRLYEALPCEDGGGRIARYPMFDGVSAMLIRLETHGFQEQRQQRDGMEINFCVSGRFESSFTSRDQVALGYYEGVCIDVDCARAAQWMSQHAAPLAPDFAALRENLLGSQWYIMESAGPRREHVFRELFENLPYFHREYLQLKTLELFMLLRSVPREMPPRDYCSAQQLRLASHLRDHLLTDRNNYVSLAHLAREHQLSVSHLQRLFRQVYGMPVYHYIREYRLEQAAVELTRSGKRIVDVALDAGYDSASKFSEAFKKRYGVTPSAYRIAAADASKRNILRKME